MNVFGSIPRDIRVMLEERKSVAERLRKKSK